MASVINTRPLLWLPHPCQTVRYTPVCLASGQTWPQSHSSTTHSHTHTPRTVKRASPGVLRSPSSQPQAAPNASSAISHPLPSSAPSNGSTPTGSTSHRATAGHSVVTHRDVMQQVRHQRSAQASRESVIAPHQSQTLRNSQSPAHLPWAGSGGSALPARGHGGSAPAIRSADPALRRGLPPLLIVRGAHIRPLAPFRQVESVDAADAAATTAPRKVAPPPVGHQSTRTQRALKPRAVQRGSQVLHSGLSAVGSDAEALFQSARRASSDSDSDDDIPELARLGFGLSTGFPAPMGYAREGAMRTFPRLPTDTIRALPRLQPQESAREREERAAAEDAEARRQTAEARGEHLAAIHPVFRTSPFSADMRRARADSPTARILFLDEGNFCRSILAEAVLASLVATCLTTLNVEIESASVGPAFGGGHDQRILEAAAEAHLSLRPRQARCFDEVHDIAAFDLVLVMDHFDYTEVLREVAVLDKINPGGLYCSRVRRLSQYVNARRRISPLDRFLGHNEIADPLYGNYGDLDEGGRLQETLAHLSYACSGLLDYLTQLQRRCVGTITMPQAMAQSLQCPLLDPSYRLMRPAVHHIIPPAPAQPWSVSHKVSPANNDSAAVSALLENSSLSATIDTAGLNPVVWHSGVGQAITCTGSESNTIVDPFLGPALQHSASGGGKTAQQLRESSVAVVQRVRLTNEAEMYTSFMVAGKRRVSKRAPRKHKHHRGFWKEPGNVDTELRAFIAEHGLGCRMPTSRELRAAGANALDVAVIHHGGYHVFGERLQAVSAKLPRGHWRNFDNLAAVLRPLLQPAAPCPGTTTMVLPTHKQLIELGHGELLRAIQLHGGTSEVTRKLGFEPLRGSLTSMEALRSSIDRLQSVAGACAGDMPTKAQLKEHGQERLLNAIVRQGGFQHCAAALGLRYKMKSRLVTHPSAETPPPDAAVQCTAGETSGRMTTLEWMFEKGFKAIVGRQAVGRRAMRSRDFDKRIGACKRVHAISQDLHGLAETTHLQQLSEQVRSFVEAVKHGKDVDPVIQRFPTGRQLEAAGRFDLLQSINSCGGSKRLAAHMGMHFTETRGRKPASNRTGLRTSVKKVKKAPAVGEDVSDEFAWI